MTSGQWSPLLLTNEASFFLSENRKNVTAEIQVQVVGNSFKSLPFSLQDGDEPGRIVFLWGKLEVGRKFR